MLIIRPVIGFEKFDIINVIFDRKYLTDDPVVQEFKLSHIRLSFFKHDSWTIFAFNTVIL